MLSTTLHMHNEASPQTSQTQLIDEMCAFSLSPLSCTLAVTLERSRPNKRTWCSSNAASTLAVYERAYITYNIGRIPVVAP